MKDQDKVWDAIAPSWEKRRRDIWLSVLNFLNGASGKVLDLGCGTGRNFIEGKDYELYAVDFSSEMIRLAKEHADFKGIKGEFSVMKSYNLDYSNNFFDYILCWSMLHCIETNEKRRGTIREIYRVLKPGGKVLISTWSRGSATLKNKDKESMVAWSDTEESIKELRYTYIYDMDEFEKELREVGFVIEKIWEDKNINALLTKAE